MGTCQRDELIRSPARQVTLVHCRFNSLSRCELILEERVDIGAREMISAKKKNLRRRGIFDRTSSSSPPLKILAWEEKAIASIHTDSS